VFDDYAHHPTEVRATLEAARTLDAERVVAVFQPHLYSRTQHLAKEFGEALALADAAMVVDIYPARELPEDFPGVTATPWPPRRPTPRTGARSGGSRRWTRRPRCSSASCVR